MSDKLTDGRPKFTRIDNVVFTHFELTPHEFIVYAALCYHADYDTGESWPGLRLLQKECKVSRPKLVKCIEVLESKGLIRVVRQTDPENEKRNLTNHYFIEDANVIAARGGKPRLPGVVNQDYQGGKPRLPKRESLNKNQLTTIADEKPSADNSKKKTKATNTTPAARMNPMKDAIVAAFGWDQSDVADWGAIIKTAKNLCGAGYQPDDIPGIYAHVKAKNFPSFTPAALSKYAADWKSEHAKTITRLAQSQDTTPDAPPMTDQERADFVADMQNALKEIRANGNKQATGVTTS